MVQTRYIWAVICGILAFVLAKVLMHHGFWLALLVGLVVAAIVLLLAPAFAGSEPEGFAGAAPAVAPAPPAAPTAGPTVPVSRPDSPKVAPLAAVPAAAVPPAPVIPAPVQPQATEPVTMPAAPVAALADPKSDDLKQIEGIGPALEKMLQDLGVTRFAQIAAWTEAEVAAVDAQMGRFRGRIARDKWVAQAKIIVTEGLDAFRERAKTNDY